MSRKQRRVIIPVNQPEWLPIRVPSTLSNNLTEGHAGPACRCEVLIQRLSLHVDCQPHLPHLQTKSLVVQLLVVLHVSQSTILQEDVKHAVCNEGVLEQVVEQVAREEAEEAEEEEETS